MATIRDRFVTLPPTPEAASQMEEIREHFAQLASHLSQRTPVSREQSLGLTRLEEAKYWFNQSIIVEDNDQQRTRSELEDL